MGWEKKENEKETSRRLRVFSRASCCGAHGSPARTVRRTFGPRAGFRGACSRRPKWRELVLFRCIASRLAEPRKTIETPLFQVLALLLLYHVCTTPSLKLPSSLLCGSHGTTAVAHRALPFCDGHGRCICVFVPCSCRPGKEQPTPILKRGANNWMLLRIRTI